MTLGVANQYRHMTFARHARDGVIGIGNEAHSADGRRWQNGGAVGLIIERNIARDDRHIQGGHGGPYALDGAYKLPHNFRLFRISKVQIIRCGQGQGTNRCEIAIGFCHGLLATFEGIGRHVARCHIRCEGQGLLRAMHPNDTRAQARRAQAVGHHLAVILFINPLFGRVIRA